MGDNAPEAIEIQCPSCERRFRLTPKKGRLPSGSIPCPRCQGDIPQAVIRDAAEDSGWKPKPTSPLDRFQHLPDDLTANSTMAGLPGVGRSGNPFKRADGADTTAPVDPSLLDQASSAQSTPAPSEDEPSPGDFDAHDQETSPRLVNKSTIERLASESSSAAVSPDDIPEDGRPGGLKTSPRASIAPGREQAKTRRDLRSTRENPVVPKDAVDDRGSEPESSESRASHTIQGPASDLLKRIKERKKSASGKQLSSGSQPSEATSDDGDTTRPPLAKLFKKVRKRRGTDSGSLRQRLKSGHGEQVPSSDQGDETSEIAIDDAVGLSDKDMADILGDDDNTDEPADHSDLFDDVDSSSPAKQDSSPIEEVSKKRGRTTTQSMLARLKKRRQKKKSASGDASELKGSGMIRLRASDIQNLLGRGDLRLRIDGVVYEPIDESGVRQLISDGILDGDEDIAEKPEEWTPLSQHPLYLETQSAHLDDGDSEPTPPASESESTPPPEDTDAAPQLPPVEEQRTEAEPSPAAEIDDSAPELPEGTGPDPAPEPDLPSVPSKSTQKMYSAQATDEDDPSESASSPALPVAPPDHDSTPPSEPTPNVQPESGELPVDDDEVSEESGRDEPGDDASLEEGVTDAAVDPAPSEDDSHSEDDPRVDSQPTHEPAADKGTEQADLKDAPDGSVQNYDDYAASRSPDVNETSEPDKLDSDDARIKAAEDTLAETRRQGASKAPIIAGVVVGMAVLAAGALFLSEPGQDLLGSLSDDDSLPSEPTVDDGPDPQVLQGAISTAQASVTEALPPDGFAQTVETDQWIEERITAGDDRGAAEIMRAHWDEGRQDSDFAIQFATLLLELEAFDEARRVALDGLTHTPDSQELLDLHRDAVTADDRLMTYDWVELDGDAITTLQPVDAYDERQQVGAIFEHENDQRMVFKPEHPDQPGHWSYEVATWRICELIQCHLHIPTTEPAWMAEEVAESLDWPDGADDWMADANWQEVEIDGQTSRIVYGSWSQALPEAAVPFPLEGPTRWIRQWRRWLTAGESTTLLEEPLPEHLESLDVLGDGSLATTLREHTQDMTVGDGARQISALIVYDFLINYFERFADDQALFGTDMPLVDGHMWALHHGDAFQLRDSRRVQGRFEWTSRVSRTTVRTLDAIDRDLAGRVLFPEATAAQERRMERFWTQRQAILDRVDQLQQTHGEDAILYFP